MSVPTALRVALAAALLLSLAGPAAAEASLLSYSMRAAEAYWGERPDCGRPGGGVYEDERSAVVAAVDTGACRILLDRSRTERMRPAAVCDLVLYAWRALTEMPMSTTDPVHEVRAPWRVMYRAERCERLRRRG